MSISDKKLLQIKKYIDENFAHRNHKNEMPVYGCDFEEFEELKKRILARKSKTWQEALFALIDKKGYKDSDVYKRCGVTKQTFSKIRSDENYHPDKYTAIRLCIGLKLNIDETLNLLNMAGYTLSPSIKRELVVEYFIENKVYNMMDLNIVLDKLKLRIFK